MNQEAPSSVMTRRPPGGTPGTRGTCAPGDRNRGGRLMYRICCHLLLISKAVSVTEPKNSEWVPRFLAGTSDVRAPLLVSDGIVD